jgi:hypothetical protein
LSLLNGEGARLLVVVSDGAYRSDQRALAKKWVKRCAESGVAVLWMPFEGDYYVKGIVKNHGATILGGRLDPASAASEIGKAASTALTNVGKRNTA